MSFFENNQNYDKRRLWGRAQGRPLSAHQDRLVGALLPKISALEYVTDQMPGLTATKKHVLEIGFGGAEHLLHCAARDPQTQYIGAEPFLNGVAKALSAIEGSRVEGGGIDNVVLHHGDVWALLEKMNEGAVAEIYILYPDPWPKPRHYKRRLIQEEFIAQLYRVLKPDGVLYFASDIVSYVDWALARILRFQDEQGNGFDWDVSSGKDWTEAYPNWPSTRYEAKALREGRTPHYFSFTKTDKISD